MISASNLTSCGLQGIESIPYGIHMCHFYEGAEDLAAALVPYFAAGLRNNERCLWICAEPLDAKQAKIATQKAGLDVEAAIRKGALKILDYGDWYSQAGRLTRDEMVQVWLVEESRALADGYRGLRTTGNISFVTPETWDAFMDYEHAANAAFDGRRIVALCTYRLQLLAGSDVLDVSRRHHCTLHRPDKGWQILTAGNRV